MKHRTILISSALVALLATPAAADAHRVSSSKSVRAHVSAADRAVGKFDLAVKADAGASAQSALAGTRRHMRAASREAARLRRTARGVRESRRAALATARVGLQANENAEVLAAGVGSLDGALQADAAAELNANLLTAAGALSALSGLTGDLPASAQGALVGAIGQLSQVQGVLSTITSLLDAGQLAGTVQRSLLTSMALAIRTVDAGIETLGSLLGSVSATAVPVVQRALGSATQQLAGVTGTLQALAASGIPALPSLGGGSGSVQVGIDGSVSSVSVSGLCGLLPALPMPLRVPVC